MVRRKENKRKKVIPYKCQVGDMREKRRRSYHNTCMHIPLISEGCTLESSKALSLAATTCWPGWGRLAWMSAWIVVVLVDLIVEREKVETKHIDTLNFE